MSIRFCDISEFQEVFNANAYLKANNQVIICRTHNGDRPDSRMPGRMAQLRTTPFVLVGWYLYLVQSRDSKAQATDFVNGIGRIRDNEFAIVDHEEGSGDQTGRCQAALSVVDQWAGRVTTLYSGQSFLKDHLGGVSHWGRRPLWIASYPNSGQPELALYPPGATFWQYTSRASFTGVAGAVDASWYKGTAQELRADVIGGSAPRPALPADTQSVDVGTMKDGRQEIFVELKSGEIMHRWNVKEGGWVEGWHSLGTPG